MAFPNRVGVTVADGYAQTRNFWEATNTLAIRAFWFVTPPPFAERFRVEFDNPVAAASAEVLILDGGGSSRSFSLGVDQPEGALWVGGARAVRVMSTVPTAAWLKNVQPKHVISDR